MPDKTLIILNPHAGSGKAGKLWSKIEPLLWRELGELVVAITQRPNEIAPHLDKARAAGLRKVIAIGGDGTNHAIVNELVKLNKQNPDEAPMTFGSLPIGTGRDWARTFGVPLDITEAVEWIKSAHPLPVDIGHVRTEALDYHFLNIASIGISGEIARRVNRLARRRSWTFYRQTVEALLWYRPPKIKVYLDDRLWYDGGAYVVTVANGQNFGHGMRIAPEAKVNDGLFDVVLVEEMSRVTAIKALSSVYSGKHVERSDVQTQRAKSVRVETISGNAILMELDGELGSGSPVLFDVLPGALPILTHHSQALA